MDKKYPNFHQSHATNIRAASHGREESSRSNYSNTDVAVKLTGGLSLPMLHVMPAGVVLYVIRYIESRCVLVALCLPLDIAYELTMCDGTRHRCGSCTAQNAECESIPKLREKLEMLL